MKVRKDIAIAICELCWPNVTDWLDQQLAEKVEEVVYLFKYGELLVEDQDLAEELCRLMGWLGDGIEIVSEESESPDNPGVEGCKT